MAATAIPQAKLSGLREAAAVLGPASYWAWCLLVLSGVGNPHSTEREGFVMVLAMAALSIAVTIAGPFFADPKHRVWLLSVVPLAVFGLAGPSPSADAPLGWVLFVLASRGLGVIDAMLLWGYWFGLIDTKKISAVVAKAVALTVGMFLVLVTLPEGLTLTIGRLLPVVSAIAYLLVSAVPSEKTLETSETIRSSLLAFHIERAAISVGLGLTGALVVLGSVESTNGNANGLSALLAGIIAAIALIGIAIYTKRRSLSAKYLPALPLLISGFLLIPFLSAESGVIVQIAYASAWLCWTVMSVVRASWLHISQRSPSIGGKLAVIGGWLLGLLLGWAVIYWADVVSSQLATIAIVAFAYVIVLVATLSLVGYVTRRSLVSQQESSFEEQLAAACARIAAEHQLTMREQEVLSLLASGRSRPYIEATLHISTGTAKTHILHIYDKMGVHDREQLLDLAQKYMKELSKTTSEQE